MNRISGEANRSSKYDSLLFFVRSSLSLFESVVFFFLGEGSAFNESSECANTGKRLALLFIYNILFNIIVI